MNATRRKSGSLAVLLAILAVTHAVRADDDDRWRYRGNGYGWYPQPPLMVFPPVVVPLPSPVIVFPPLPQVVIGYPPVVAGAPFRGAYPHGHGWHRGWYHGRGHGH